MPDPDPASEVVELATSPAFPDGPGEPAALQALSDAVVAVAGVLDVEPVLQIIVDRVRTLVGARYAALGIVNDRHRIERFITSGITPQERARLGPPPEGHGLLGVIIREGQSIRIPEIADHPASYGFPPLHPPMHSLLGVPVRVRNLTIGNLYLTDKVDAPAFSAEDQRLVELFALHAGIAIENARLHEALGRLAVIDERERIGKDLHDGIIQSLYGIALSLEVVPEIMADEPEGASARVDGAIDSLNRTIADLRRFIFGLRPELVERTDMIGLLIALTEQLRQSSVIDVELDITDVPVELPAHARAELLQIAREGLSNVARHSAASTVRVSLAIDADQVRLEITDNGRGFETREIPVEGHYGLSNMRDRAVALGGSMELDGRPGAGTRIMVRVPTAGHAPGPAASREDGVR